MGMTIQTSECWPLTAQFSPDPQTLKDDRLLKAMEYDETALRRRLLFRLLRNFDFDNPTFKQAEMITNPVPEIIYDLGDDEFHFNFIGQPFPSGTPYDPSVFWR